MGVHLYFNGKYLAVECCYMCIVYLWIINFCHGGLCFLVGGMLYWIFFSFFVRANDKLSRLSLLLEHVDNSHKVAKYL